MTENERAVWGWFMDNPWALAALAGVLLVGKVAGWLGWARWVREIFRPPEKK